MTNSEIMLKIEELQHELEKNTVSPLPEIWYHARKKVFYLRDNRGHWIEYPKGVITTTLKLAGLSTKLEGGTMSELDAKVYEITQNNVIDDVLDLAGYEKGVQNVNGKRVLILTSPSYIIAEKGDYSLIEELLTQVLGEDQKQYLKSWLKISIRNLREEGFSARGHAVFFVGEKNSCKTLIQDNIITPCLGRYANPVKYLMGETPFNAELFGAEHLCMGDCRGKDWSERGEFTVGLKGFIANLTHFRHQKGQDAGCYNPKWRITVSLNDDVESMKIIPLMDNSMEDKISVLKCVKPDMSNLIPKEVLYNESKLSALFQSQIPAFIFHLLNDFTIKDEDLSARFGIKPYLNKDLLHDIRISPVSQELVDTIEEIFDINELNLVWEGKSGHFLDLFKSIGYNLDPSFNTPVKLGYKLKELSETSFEKIKVVRINSNSNVYSVSHNKQYLPPKTISLKTTLDTIRKVCGMNTSNKINSDMFKSEFDKLKQVYVGKYKITLDELTTTNNDWVKELPPQ